MKFYEDEFINQYKEILDELQPSSKVLDSSCGNGVKVTALKRKGIDVVGTDISEEMIRLTKEYAESNSLILYFVAAIQLAIVQAEVKC